MDYLIDRLRVAPCSELRVVTRPEKTDVIANAARHGAVVVSGRPGSVAESIAMGISGLPDEDIVLFGFPDTLWEPEDGYRRLIPLVEKSGGVALGLFRAEELERSDVVEIEASGHVTRIAVKPKQPSSDLIWGCAAARAGCLRALGAAAEPSEHFNLLCDDREVRGVWLSDVWIDVGTRLALRKARQAGGWRHPAEVDPQRASRSGTDGAGLAARTPPASP